VQIYALSDRHGVEIGMVELDFRVPGCCEIAYFGLIQELAGKGLGRWLMQHSLGLAWRKDVTLVHVHSCTLDHPSALNFYRKAGFVAVRQSVETFADPRLISLLPEDCAPQIPLLRPDSR
jgi:GNAT superfamily N-acetyltransferase